ncbi:hypothetical protein ACLOJK_018941, partial [Asimina triloba]
MFQGGGGVGYLEITSGQCEELHEVEDKEVEDSISSLNLRFQQVWGQKPVEHAVSWAGFDRAHRQEPVGRSIHVAVEQVLIKLVDRILSGTL